MAWFTRLPLLFALVACGPKGRLIEVTEPTSVRVSYTSGHNLFKGRWPRPVLRTEQGEVVAPADHETWSIEAHRTTLYYVLGPGAYRLFEHRYPVIKTLRRRVATRN